MYIKCFISLKIRLKAKQTQARQVRYRIDAALDRTALEVLSDSHSLQAVDVATSLYIPLRQRCALSQHELTHLFTAALRDFLTIDSPPVRRAICLTSLVSLLEQSPALIVNIVVGARDGEFPSALEKKREEIQHREEARLWGRLECQFRKHQLILARHMCLASPVASLRDRRDRLLDYAFQSLGTAVQVTSQSQGTGD